MEAKETELEMVRRHVREDEGHLAHQQALIARLRASELPIGEAEALLENFLDLQHQHEAHLAWLQGERV